jgi:hypothetical protein
MGVERLMNEKREEILRIAAKHRARNAVRAVVIEGSLPKPGTDMLEE